MTVTAFAVVVPQAEPRAARAASASCGTAATVGDEPSVEASPPWPASRAVPGVVWARMAGTMALTDLEPVEPRCWG